MNTKNDAAFVAFVAEKANGFRPHIAAMIAERWAAILPAIEDTDERADHALCVAALTVRGRGETVTPAQLA